MRLPAALLLLLASTTAPHAAPNIVVIMTDDQEDTGSMAYMPKTHALLAEKGITFENSFVNLPLCAPSRASFFTGQAAHSAGIKANNPSDGGGWGGFKEKEANALPVWLKKAGYKTALIGKYLNRYGQESRVGSLLSWAGSYLDISFTGARIGNPEGWVAPGWDLWFAFTGTRARYFDYAINENGTIRNFGEAASDGKCAIPAAQYADVFKQVSLPAAAPDKKKSPVPATAVRGESKEQIEKCYRAELQSLQSVDDVVAAVVDALQRDGKLDDTVIIYTSDNGFLFGQHQLFGKSAPFEEAIRCRSSYEVLASRKTRPAASS